jgi:hypothetical protein
LAESLVDGKVLEMVEKKADWSAALLGERMVV